MASDESEQLVYAGCGSGTFILDGSSAEPVLATGMAAKLYSNGMVRDIELTTTHIYQAAGTNGLVRYARGTSSKFPPIQYGAAANAWAVDVAVHDDDDDFDLVFIGTNDAETSGTLYMLRTQVSEDESPLELDTLTFDKPIYALASHRDGNNLMLLVGTACGPQLGNGNPIPYTPGPSLWRYDFDLTSGLPQTIPAETESWVANVPFGSASTDAFAFVRDIVIDPATEQAYVAAFSHGVFKLDVSGSSLSQVTTGGWPIQPPGAHVGHYSGLALHDGTFGKLLAVALGPAFKDERLFWGECSIPIPCDNPNGNQDTGYDGIRLYDISGSSYTEVGSLAGHDPNPREDPDLYPFMPARHRRNWPSERVPAPC